MWEKLLTKMTDENCLIIDELVELISDEHIEDENMLKKYQEDIFRTNGEYLTHKQQLERCKKMLFMDIISEGLDFVDYQNIMLLKEKLKTDISDKESAIIIIKLFSLLKKEMMLPYDAYLLLMKNEL